MSGTSKQLLAWPTSRLLVSNGESNAAAPVTARQLFETLDTDSDARVSLSDVVNSWHLPHGGSCQERAHVHETLQLLLLAAGQDTHFNINEFRTAVRLWHTTGGHLPSIREYALRTAAETTASAVACLAAMQVVCLSLTFSNEDMWPQISAAGGLAAVTSIAALDGHSVEPCVRKGKVHEEMPANWRYQCALFSMAGISVGVALAPAAPLASGIIGDPKGRGFGPTAVAGLAVAHLTGNALALMSVPEKLFKEWPAMVMSAAVFVGGGLTSAALGVTVARSAGREGATKAIVAGSCLLSVHGILSAGAAVRAYNRGVPEPFHAVTSLFLRLLLK